MKKAFFICVLFLLLGVVFLLSVCATQAPDPATVTVIDKLDVLTPEEEKSLSPTSFDTHGISFYLITMQTAYVDDRLSDHEIYVACGMQSPVYDAPDAVVLVVRMTGIDHAFYYEMYTYSDAYDIFSDHDINRILDADEVYDNLKAGKIKEGATAFFSLCAREIDEHYEALAAKERRRPLMVALISVGAGVLAAGISILAVVLSYRKKLHGETYPLDRYARLNLTHREDRFVGSYVTRVRVHSNTSGGSRGGGGGGGGGFRGGR